jgi:hypothetical protein
MRFTGTTEINVHRIRRACHLALSDGIPVRSLWIAAVVGTVLNVINQGDTLLGSAPINWLKVILTYMVPYCVCTYGAVSFQMRSPTTTLK